MDPLFFLTADEGLLPHLQNLRLDTKTLAHRLFVYTKDTQPLPDDVVLGVLQKTQKLFEEEFAPSIDRGSCRETHELLEVIRCAKSYYKYIPLMKDAHKCIRAASSMLYIETIAPALSQKNDLLLCMQTSVQYAKALSFYEAQAKAYESLGDSTPITDKISALSQIVTKTEQQLEEAVAKLQGKDKALTQETLALYEEIFAFCYYAATCLAKEGSTEILASLLASIRKKLPARFATIFESPELIEDPKSPECLYVQQSRSVVMPADYYFRSGKWIRALLGREHSTEITQLQDIARALYSLKCTLQERLKQMASGQTQVVGGFYNLEGEASHYKELINGLERLILIQLQQLAKRPPSKKGRSTWQYIETLFKRVKELQIASEQFCKLAAGPYRFCMLAFGKLVRYLDVANSAKECKDDFIWLEPTVRLFEATEAARTLSENSLAFHKRVFKVIHQSIAIAGSRNLILGETESKIPHRLFAKSPFEADERELLQSYLTKNLLRLTRFSESAIDPLFEVSLHMLKHDPLYEPLYQDIVQTSPILSGLLTTYSHKSNTNDFYIELELMKCACVALERASLQATNQTDPHAAVLGYYEARQLLEDLKDHKRQKFTDRLEWLEKTIKAFGSKHDALLNIDPELELSSCKSLFRPLICAVFSSDISASDAATSEIKNEINSKNFTAPEASSLLGTLLQRWAIQNAQKL